MSSLTPEAEDGLVTYGECYRVQPFGNTVSTVSLTGAARGHPRHVGWRLGPGPGRGPHLRVARQRSGRARVVAGDVTVGGAPLVPTDVYRVTVNSIVADPARSPPIVGATDVVGAGVDVDLLVAYFGSASPLTPGTEPRLVRLP